MHIAKAWPVLQDVVYYFSPQQSGNINVSLCQSAGQTFDTKLYVLQDLGATSPAPVPVACNDDFCGYQSSLTVRLGAAVHSP